MKASKPFAIKPREFAPNNFAPAMLRASPVSEKIPTTYPAEIRIKTLPAAWAWGSRRGNKGGMCGGPSGGNTLGVVPAAFRK